MKLRSVIALFGFLLLVGLFTPAIAGPSQDDEINLLQIDLDEQTILINAVLSVDYCINKVYFDKSAEGKTTALVLSDQTKLKLDAPVPIMTSRSE